MPESSVRSGRGRVTQVPAIVWGRRLAASSADADSQILETSAGSLVSYPRCDNSLIDRLTGDRGQNDIHDESVESITSFLFRVGQNWAKRDYPRRQLFESQLQRVVGLSAEMAAYEANLIAVLLRSRSRWLDLLEAETGSWEALDDWVRSSDTRVRAFPLGLVLHLLPGTVPIAGVLSMIRAAITKNVSIVKPAIDDVITPTALALSFMDVDADHPVTRSVSVLHWSHDAPLGAELARRADAIVAWGGRPAMRWARVHAGDDTRVIPFGPKKSVAIVGRDADLTQVGRRLAHDVCMYEQRGCFSVRQIFTETDDVEPLVDALADGLRTYGRLLPMARRSIDEQAASTIFRLEADYFGDYRVGEPEDGWQIAVRVAESVRDLPFARCVYVHPGWSPERVAREYVSAQVQTVVVEPWRLAVELRDLLGKSGVARVAEAGQANLFRTGGTHDGIRPLSMLLRYVTCDPASTYLGKGLVTPIDQTALLEEPVFGERFSQFAP